MPPKRKRGITTTAETNPDVNGEIIDGNFALRASPDAEDEGEALKVEKVMGQKAVNGKNGLKVEGEEGDSDLSHPPLDAPSTKKPKRTPTKASLAAKKGSDEIKAFKAEQAAKKATVKMEDGDDGPDEVEDMDTERWEAGRAPPVNSDYLPLPWKGRLGYACLNTYLRFSNPPVFSSRTCRIASILEHRHPLSDPTQPSHPTKNRPNKGLPASIALGQKYVEDIGLANARDIVKMLRWNEKYGIRFLRLSSEMFPFASHEEYGYTLESFAADALEKAGKVAAELGHRLTTHPGQFTQLGSPRQAVIDNAIRDLAYHTELLSLLKLPPQQDRDAVMILHLGGTFGDKAATLQRFKDNYIKLPQEIKNRLVLENDDVSRSVHDLLPVCEELNIPLVLDFHHHNIIFDADKLREGTKDIMELFPRIKATWDRKGITQKMHYSEPTPQAITGRQRRKHNPRPATLPPCASDMDLMIEAKDKEQAVFELMRTFRLPGWDTFNNIIPYERADDNKPEPRKAKKKKTKKQLKAEEEDPSLIELEEPEKPVIPDEEVGMGGPLNRVYWPPGMEEWLRPKKREVKKKGSEEVDTAAEDEIMANPTPMNLKRRQEIKANRKGREDAGGEGEVKMETPSKKAKTTSKGSSPVKRTPRRKAVDTPSPSEAEDETMEEEEDEGSMSDLSDGLIEHTPQPSARRTRPAGRSSARKAAKAQVSYAESDGEAIVDSP